MIRLDTAPQCVGWTELVKQFRALPAVHAAMHTVNCTCRCMLNILN